MKGLRALLFMAILILSPAFASAESFVAPYVVSPPTVDGVIDPVEWQNSNRYDLTFINLGSLGDRTIPIYFENDGTYLYCAATVPFPTQREAFFGIYIDGDHSHTFSGVMSEPHIDIGYNKAGSTTPRYWFYDTYWAEVAPCGVVQQDAVTPPSGTEHAFTGSSELFYEFKISLSDLTAQPGETVGLEMHFGTDGTSSGSYFYPSTDYCDIANWPDLNIDAPPPLGAPFVSAPPVIDGVIHPIEWQNANKYDLQFQHYNLDEWETIPTYFMNDGTWLYIGLSTPFPTHWENYCGVGIDGDHSHTFSGQFTEPYIDIGYNKAGSSAPRYWFYDAYWSNGTSCGGAAAVAPPPGTDHAFSGSTALSYEFKISLADLTASPGNTVGLMLRIGTDGTTSGGYDFPYFDIRCEIPKWVDLKIEEGGSQATGEISGIVDDYAYEHIPNALVEALQNGTVISSTHSNEEGRFLLVDLLPGVYSVRASAEGYYASTETGIEVTAGVNTDIGIIFLENIYPDPHTYLATLQFDGQDEPYAETNFPISFRFNTTQDGNGDGANTVEDNLENLILRGIGDRLFGTGRTGQTYRGPNDQMPAVYFHNASIGEYDVWEYWLYYGDNDNAFAGEFEIDPLFDHEHDWEWYFIYLKNGLPEWVGLSAHDNTRFRKYDSEFHKDEDGHIIILVEGDGSHSMEAAWPYGPCFQDGVEIRSDGTITKRNGILDYGDGEQCPWVIYSNDPGFSGIRGYTMLPDTFYFGDRFYRGLLPWWDEYSDPRPAPWKHNKKLWDDPPEPKWEPMERLVAMLFCRVDFRLTDPEGRTVDRDNPVEPIGFYFEDDLNGDGQKDDYIEVHDALPGKYSIGIIPEAEAQPTDSYSLEIYLDTVKYVLAQGAKIQDIPDRPYAFWTIPVGSISGTVSDSLGGLLGVTVDLFDSTGVLAQLTYTDSSGFFEFDSDDAGDYTISIVTPLGYVADFESRPITVTWNADSTVDFTLHALDMVLSQRSMGYWKHQVNVHLSGKGNAQESLTDISDYMSLVEEHFNNHPTNPITIFEAPQPADQTDSLEALQDLLTVKENAGMNAKARQQLIALMLNVVSLKLDQATPISQDSATVSQAITYCNRLITDADESNDELAKDIADNINNGILVASEVIPLTTPNIAYKGTEDQATQTPSVPAEFSLEQNYPNPFNPVCNIKYALPTECHVTLSIYNILGQRVRVLVDEYQSAGNKSVKWDSKDDQRREVTSGIYFYRIKAGDFTETKKMVLLR